MRNPTDPTLEIKTYKCKFDRVGRTHDVEVSYKVRTFEELADKLYEVAREHCASSEVDVFIDTEKMEGRLIVGGIRPAGSCVIEEIPA